MVASAAAAVAAATAVVAAATAAAAVVIAAVVAAATAAVAAVATTAVVAAVTTARAVAVAVVAVVAAVAAAAIAGNSAVSVAATRYVRSARPRRGRVIVFGRGFGRSGFGAGPVRSPIGTAWRARASSARQIVNARGFLAPGAGSRQHSPMRSLVFGVLSVAALAGGARADSLSDQLGPREIAVGEALRGGATGAAGVDLNPGGLPLNRELVFEGGYGYRAADSASLIGVSACDSTNAAPGCFFYDYAGSNPELGGMTVHRTTHVGGLTLSRMIVSRVLVGATGKYYRFSSGMTGESDASGTAIDLGVTLRLTDLINLGISAQNLWESSSTPEFPRAVGGGFYAHLASSLALSFDARWRLDGSDQSARYGGGAELFLTGQGGQSGYPIRLGALHDNGLGATYLSAGLGFASVNWGIDVAGRREVKGGDETLIIASMRFFGPRLPSPGVDQ